MNSSSVKRGKRGISPFEKKKGLIIDWARGLVWESLSLPLLCVLSSPISTPPLYLLRPAFPLISLPLSYRRHSLSHFQPLSLSLSFPLSRSLLPFFPSIRCGQVRSKLTIVHQRTRVGEAEPEGTEVAGASSIQREATNHGGAKIKWQKNAIFGHPHCWFMVPTHSSQPVLQNGTFDSWQKCQNRQHVFLCKNKNFAIGFKPNRTLFWRNDPEFTLIMKNTCLCLKSFVKSHIFWDRIWNW